jgi:sugar lactone lactonase YvrE
LRRDGPTAIAVHGVDRDATDNPIGNVVTRIDELSPPARDGRAVDAAHEVFAFCANGSALTPS